MPENPTAILAPTNAATDDEDIYPEEVIQEFMKKYGKIPKAKFFAQMSEAFRKQEEELPTLTPLTIPPRPKTLIETPTSQALSTHRENPQILPETLTQKVDPTKQNPRIETLPQETTPLEPILQTEAKTPTNKEDESEEKGDKMDTEESESEEDVGEQVENQEGEELGGEDITGSGVEEETRKDVEGHDGSKVGEDKEDGTGDVEETDGQVVEDNAGSEEESKEEEEGRIDEAEKINEGLEGRLGEVGEENAESDKGDGEKESVPFDEERLEKPAEEEEMETEIVLLDDVETDDQETPRDERSTRRQFHRNKKHEDEALASRAKRLRLENIEETEEVIPQV